MPIDMSKYQRAPNGIVNVLRPDEANKQLSRKLQKQLMESKSIYVAQNDEVEKLRIALKAGQPVMLLGPPGVGKTTLVSNIAREMKLPLGLISGSRAKYWEVVGYVDEHGGESVYHDRPVSLHARASDRSVLYLDEAIEFPPDIFTSLSSMLDHRQALPLKETGEELSTSHVSIILAFNPPTIDYRDKLPTPATLDRAVVIRFEAHEGQTMLRVLRVKYGLDKDPKTGELYGYEGPMKDALNRYGEALAKTFDDLNSQTAIKHQSVVIKKVTTRSAEIALRLICEGLPAKDAVEIAMVNPMVPLEDELVPKFLKAAREVVESWAGRR